MPRILMTIRLVGAFVVACFMAALPSATASATPQSAKLAAILGSGSTWSANAVNKWIANVYTQGVQVVFNPTGSAQGRQDFANHTVDFGVSDIGYQGVDPVTGTPDSSPNRKYAYLPVTSGGTSFPYNIIVGGHRIINLRLSGLTIAKIFMNKITNWDARAVTNDNNGRQLPSLPITVVVPSEGSGTTAMFTRYLNYDFKSMWVAYDGGHKGMTEYWPRQGNQVAQDGSTQIMNYVQSPSANGAIGIAEYSYPLQAGLPVVQMENAAGYYVLPTQWDDAVALTQAQIDYTPGPDYLLQNLDKVYNYNDKRAYPLSSYSYTIMPVQKNDPRMAVSGNQYPAKWQTLADFLYYSICQGQEYTGKIGYSSLPVNLVEAGFKQIDRIKQAAPKVHIGNQNITTCRNPTFIAGHPNENYLAVHAPEPPLCDKVGHGPCVGTVNGNNPGNQNPTPTPSSSASGSSTPGAVPTTGTTPGAVGPGVNPTVGPAANGPPASPYPGVLTAGAGSNMTGALEALAAVLLVAILAAPPLLARRWSARSRRQS